MKDIQKIKEFFSKPLEEADINDPVLMKARAAAFQRSQPKPEIPKPPIDDKELKELMERILRKMKTERTV